MTQVIKPEQYYQIVAHYMIAVAAQEEVRKQERLIANILEQSATESVADAIYNPIFRGTKSEIDKLLLEKGVMVEWSPAKNKFANKPIEEEGNNVSG